MLRFGRGAVTDDRLTAYCLRLTVQGSRLTLYRLAAGVGLLGLASLGACIVPTDRSGELSVQVDDIPSLIVNDTVQLVADVVESDGSTLPNAEVRFSADNANVLNVSPDGRVLAVGSGDANIFATAIGFVGTEAATLPVRVRDALEIDSISPNLVRFGETVQLFGVGLDPRFLFFTLFGGVESAVESYTPVEPDRPARFGTLSLWVTPPATKTATAALLGIEGLALSPGDDTVRVIQRDRYEPNDSVPRSLNVSGGLFNPALAFERVRRGDNRLPVDWYTFTTDAIGDWTISAWTVGGGHAFRLYVTDSIGWSGAAFTALGFGVYAVGSQAWGVGAGFRPCQGLGLHFPKGGETGFPLEVRPDSVVIPLRDLPAGTYHVFISFGEGAPFFNASTNVSGVAVFVDSLNIVDPIQTGLRIVPGYHSMLQPDALEENDYCDVASTIDVPDTLGPLTIDSPHDADWYRFHVGGSGEIVRFSLAVADSNADLDMYVVRDVLPDSLVLVDFGFGTDISRNETAGLFLDPGDYFLIVVDFFGIPTEYTLSSRVLTGVPDRLPLESASEQLALRRQQTRARRLRLNPQLPRRR